MSTSPRGQGAERRPAADAGESRCAARPVNTNVPRILVMGVAGSGKSTLAAQLAQELDIVLIEGDDHHSPASQDRMRRGIPLDDGDRLPWLDALGILLASRDGGAVLTCSALKLIGPVELRLSGRHSRKLECPVETAAGAQEVVEDMAKAIEQRLRASEQQIRGRCFVCNTPSAWAGHSVLHRPVESAQAQLTQLIDRPR